MGTQDESISRTECNLNSTTKPTNKIGEIMIFIYDVLNITELIITIAVKWYLVALLYYIIREKRYSKLWL